MKIKKFNMHESGLNHFFGPLEARIMEIVWASKSITIKEMQSILNQENPISFNAVMTVMSRLQEKGLLKRTTTGKGRNRVTSFEAVLSKEQFLAEQTKAVTHGLIEEFGGLVVNHMIDALDDVDPELISKLERKINEMKSRKQS
ncbi:BlaI/MecI/CopY family transcriptional regulator [Cohnella thermotolerans]|uniref:BlaI/MecI/CopY family transcriptional regulator n=1 Tax=Cohnella thermotolerans TaxID=329858 RepID=UPI00047DA11C|nr:BlaI/MecI/CopY family transcriptional regulator [Cohnella thermotolerans]